MPTYDYACQEGHTFEAFQKMSDPPLTTCPTCGAAAERRISGGGGLMLKGGGGSSSAKSTTLDGGSSKGEPPHAPSDLTTRKS